MPTATRFASNVMFDVALSPPARSGRRPGAAVAAVARLLVLRRIRRASSLHRAAGRGDACALRAALALGADPDERAGAAGGCTPLHAAAAWGRAEAVALLCSAGADVRARDALGRTPADYADVCLSPGAARQVSAILAGSDPG